MPNGIKYVTNFVESVGAISTIDQSNLSSPVQTVSGGTDWATVDESGSASITRAIKNDGTLWLWGYNFDGQLGNNSTINRSSPVQTVANGTNWKQVSGSAAIKTDGTLWLWGYGLSGALGNNSTISRSSPVQTVSATTDWKQVAGADWHTAAIKTDGTLWTWGIGGMGGLGHNSTLSRSSPGQTIAVGNNWKQVSASAFFTAPGYYFQTTAAIKTDGTLWLWGAAACGQLGNNSTIIRSSPVQTVSATTNWKQVSAGILAVAAIKTDGTLWTWGSNTNIFGGVLGQLGNNSTTNQSSPVQTVAGGTNWKQVTGNSINRVATKTDGTLWNWGCGGYGRLGNNSTTDQLSPVQTVSATNNWNIPLVGGGIKTDGTLWTWGSGSGGLLGNNSTVSQASPVQTVSATQTWLPASDALNFSAGFGSTAAVKSDGTLWLWGRGIEGQLGNNSIDSRSSPVQTVSGGTNWSNVDIFNVAAAVKTDGTLWTWGCGSYGQLGNNSTINRSSPVQTVSATTTWKQASVGSKHIAAVKTDGTLWLWGNNTYGSLGNNTSIGDRSSPIQTVSATANWKSSAAGFYVSGGIKTDGTLWMWGYGTVGRLGNNSIVSRSSPVQTIANGTNWSSLSLGPGIAGAIKTDGTLWMWGGNTYGGLGDNSTINRSSPVQTVSATTNWKQVAIGGTFTAAIKTDGTLWMWGCRIDSYGITTSSPVQLVTGGNNWDKISSSGYHVVATKTDGTLWGLGVNNFGQLGIDLSREVSTLQTVDLGDILLEKEYLLDVYPNLVPQITQPRLWMWGSNNYGQLGINSIVSQSSPVQTVSATTNWKQLSLGSRSASGIKTDGTLWQWGVGAVMGLNTAAVNRSSPIQTISATTNWKQVSTKGLLAAAIKTDGTLWLWGNSAIIGNNSTVGRSSPTQTVSATTDWKQVQTGVNSVAAVKIDGTLWTWGSGTLGRLGNNSTITRSSPVQTVSATTNWKQVSVALDHTAAIKTDGTLWLWGGGYCGMLGNGGTVCMSSPVQTLAGGTNWKFVDISCRNSVGIKTDGTLWIWGGNVYGQLGSFVASANSPIQTISSGNNWRCAVLGKDHVIAMKTDGTLWGWGKNCIGILADTQPTVVIERSPVQTIIGGNGWVAISAYGDTSAGINDPRD